MKNNIVLSILTVVVLSSCSPLENIDAVPDDQKLQIFTSKDTLIANGHDTANVIARIPKDAGIVDITFTSTAGIFMETNSKSIKQFADSLNDQYRYSTCQLKSDTSTSVVFITAETSNARQRKAIIFKK